MFENNAVKFRFWVKVDLAVAWIFTGICGLVCAISIAQTSSKVSETYNSLSYYYNTSSKSSTGNPALAFFLALLVTLICQFLEYFFCLGLLAFCDMMCDIREIKNYFTGGDAKSNWKPPVFKPEVEIKKEKMASGWSCKSCGYENEPEAKFCRNCGNAK